MKSNTGKVDRGIRLVGGAVLLILGLGPLSGLWATLAFGAGALGLVTGLLGWCPAYRVVGVSTCPRQ